jgi:hypothetical protein
MIKAKISITIVTCMLTLCSCNHMRDMTDEEREKHMKQAELNDLRNSVTQNVMGF